MAPIAFIPPTPRTQATELAPMWPYILASFGWNTCVLGVAMLVKQRWGVSAPSALGFVCAWISIPLATWLYFRTHLHNRTPTTNWGMLPRVLAL